MTSGHSLLFHHSSGEAEESNDTPLPHTDQYKSRPLPLLRPIRVGNSSKSVGTALPTVTCNYTIVRPVICLMILLRKMFISPLQLLLA